MSISFYAIAVTAAALSVALHLRAEYLGPRWQVYLFKPLTTTLLLLLAAFSPAAHGSRYQLAVVFGLSCSLMGDVFLMLPGNRFIPGLASFLLAHVLYAVAFTSGVQLSAEPAAGLALAAVAILLLRFLWHGLGRLRLPVFIYTAVILFMVWQAWGRSVALPTTGARLAAAGATLFMISDALLAVNRFRHPYRGAQALIMATYVTAQALISLSVGTR